MLPFDLHVLGLPLAFILSQDQTLHCCIVKYFYVYINYENCILTLVFILISK